MDCYQGSLGSDCLQSTMYTVLSLYAWDSKAVLNGLRQLIQILLKQVSAGTSTVWGTADSLAC